VGPLDGEHALIYQDEDGGFACGSTGKPPLPIPWPPPSIPPVRDLIAHGVVNADLVEFLREAHARGTSLIDAFENPPEVAKGIGLPLSGRAEHDLRLLAPSRLNEIKDPTDREIVHFFHKVVEDGRFLRTWATRPFEVARDLGVQLSAG